MRRIDPRPRQRVLLAATLLPATRRCLAPRPLEPDGGMTGQRVAVTWEVAEDDAFRTIDRFMAAQPRALLAQYAIGRAAAESGQQLDRGEQGHSVPLTGYDEYEAETFFPMLGMAIRVVQPGEPTTIYHWETEQEAFLMLAGEALLEAAAVAQEAAPVGDPRHHEAGRGRQQACSRARPGSCRDSPPSRWTMRVSAWTCPAVRYCSFRGCHAARQRVRCLA